MIFAYFRNQFPYKENAEYDPEHPKPLPGLALITMKCFQDRGDREVSRVKHLCRPKKGFPHHSSDPVTNKLGRKSDEDTGPLTRVSTEKQLLYGECLSRQGRDGGSRGHDDGSSVFLLVERSRVEESTYGTPSRDEESHGFTDGISQDGQEHDGDVDDLGLEVEDFLQDGAEGRETKTCDLLASNFRGSF